MEPGSRLYVHPRSEQRRVQLDRSGRPTHSTKLVIRNLTQDAHDARMSSHAPALSDPMVRTDMEVTARVISGQFGSRHDLYAWAALGQWVASSAHTCDR